ncbi:MAG: Rrf2 family transcriptional regulator [Planctomycetes bacterium]|nr:Rrf2 family transcriptional regulator [Planctomycetota bacterium]
MRLSRKGRYGVRALIALAMDDTGSPVSIKTIAAREGIPVPFLQQLFFHLKKAGLVRSVRGPGGGFMLTTAPEKIRALDILEALGERVAVTECLDGKDKKAACNLAGRCASRVLWQKLEKAIRNILGGTTLAELCKQKKGLEIGT